jgi:hypothetical protein
MSMVVVVNHVTLDGVVQGPGRPDEDTRGGFEHGGWAAAGNDQVMGAKVAEWMNGQHAFLFGRHSYEIVLESWNRMGGPSRTRSTTRPSTWRQSIPTRRFSGQTRRFCTATSRPPYPN